jgi:uncharacterized membrane protein YdjX (TVP38/TMEM64 family)
MVLRILPLLLLVILAIGLWSSGLVQHVSLVRLMDGRDTLQELIAKRFIVSMGAFLLAYMALAAMAFPISPLLSMSSGFLFGPLPGALVSVMGATLGGALLFLAARMGFAHHVSARLGPRLQAFASGFRKDASAYMLLLRVAIILPSWFVNIGSGLIGIRLFTFLWTTALGILPVTLAFAFVGSGLEKALAAELAAWRACIAAENGSCSLDLHPFALLEPELVFALIVLAGLALLSVILRRHWRARG